MDRSFQAYQYKAFCYRFANTLDEAKPSQVLSTTFELIFIEAKLVNVDISLRHTNCENLCSCLPYTLTIFNMFIKVL